MQLGLACRLDLYYQYDVMTEEYDTFIDQCLAYCFDGVNDATWWKNIENGVYIPGTAQESDIWSPIHTYLQLYHLFHQPTEGER